MGKNQESAIEYTRRVLKKGRARKALGQNFLIDDDIIERISSSIIDKNVPVIEIGSGPGGLTRILAQEIENFWAVELDSEKVAILRKEFQDYPVKILHKDALEIDLEDLWQQQKGYLVGNLPYYITNLLLMHFLEQEENLLGMTVMVQKEVAERMTARPGGKDYGILSVAVQLSAEAEKLFEVPPSAFFPQPKVTSAVVKLILRSYPGLEVDKKQLLRVVKAAFAQRRKTLLNSLSGRLGLDKNELGEKLSRLGFPEKVRAENLSILDFQEIVKVI